MRTIIFLLVVACITSTTYSQIPSVRENKGFKHFKGLGDARDGDDGKEDYEFEVLPLMDKGDRDVIFNRIFSKDNEQSLYFANEASVQFSGNGGVIESELATAYMGAFRVTFGTLLANGNTDNTTPENTEEGMSTTDTQDTDESEAFQRLLAGGGNTYLTIELPVLYYQDERAFLYFNLAARAALELTEFSSDVDTSTGNGSVYANLYASVSTDNNEFSFFINGSWGQYFGSSAFYERLDIEDGKSFSFGDLTAGVTIQNSIRVSATLGTISSEKNLETGNVTIGVQLLSDLFKKNDDG